MNPISRASKLTNGIFKEILSLTWELITNSGADDGEFEGHSWSYNPYGLYINEEEFESKEEISKWYKRWEKHRDFVYSEAKEALKHLDTIGVDAHELVGRFIYGKYYEPQDNVVFSSHGFMGHVLDWKEGEIPNEKDS